MIGNPVRFRAAGREHELRIGNRVLRELEQHFDCNAVALGDRLHDEPSVRDTTDVLRIALVGEYTLEDVDAILDDIGYPRVGLLLQDAFGQAMPDGPSESASGN